ncbi:hypothetical protein AX16_002690 [Volvariella volvacea WC 439]|nr:hypothetical protein AX16_002690 [Volvariella volvacea WC 439]
MLNWPELGMTLGLGTSCTRLAFPVQLYRPTRPPPMYSFNPVRIVLRNGPLRVTHGRSAFLARHRYSSTSTMHDNDPELLETEKQRNLSGKQHKTSAPLSDAPGWNEYLASASEAGVKADRHQGAKDVSELQATTVEYIKSRHTPDERTEPTVASYVREEVEGPLSGRGRQDPEETVYEETTVKSTRKVFDLKEHPTPSEEDVRADRGEPIIGYS